jgi:uncharacterized protein DUF3618
MGKAADQLIYQPLDDGGLAPIDRESVMQQQNTSSFESDVDSMNPDTEATKEEIERTRERMGETIDAISERLDPHTLSRQAKDAVRDATIGKVEHAAKSAGAKARDVVSTAGERVSGVAHKVKDTVVPGGDAADVDAHSYETSTVASTEKDEASIGVLQNIRTNIGPRMQNGMQQAQSGFRQSLEKKPLLVGAALIGLGALAGFAIPETEQENRFLARLRSRPFSGGKTGPSDQNGQWTV